ncbi:MAG: TIGR01777 family oxidoreductase [Saprospiraceae bacterium]|nr:TIGR01777 family oxidoreductase [Saprospiraceae bacterium]
MQKKTILIAGGTGLIGSRLAEMLSNQGHTVRLLTRSPKGSGEFFWNPAANEIENAALQDLDVVVNLAGASIADKRWTPARKKELVESREQSAAVLFREMERMPRRPKAYLSASAIGYYGNSRELWMLEDTAPVDQSFMMECCQKWESAADQMTTLGIRTVKFRIGVVMAKEGGALAEIVKPLRFGLGAYFGNGQAWWSWVHRDDVCRAFLWAIDNQSVEGVFNLVSPTPARGKDLVKATAKAMHQLAVFLPAPAFILRLILGEMSAVILNSNRISSEKLTQAGFEFQWPEINTALRDIFA